VHGGLRTRLFGYADERKMERRLIADQKKTIDSSLDTTDVDRATEIAGIPERIRGCGHVKHTCTRQGARGRAAGTMEERCGSCKRLRRRFLRPVRSADIFCCTPLQDAREYTRRLSGARREQSPIPQSDAHTAAWR
jgi:hypothetical protein